MLSEGAGEGQEKVQTGAQAGARGSTLKASEGVVSGGPIWRPQLFRGRVGKSSKFMLVGIDGFC